MDCLDDTTVARFLRGELDPDALRRTETHLGECEECRGCVADLARLESTASGPRTPGPQLGQVIGRYMLRDILGAGGMGVVYAAHDQVLNRTVALKVLRDDPDETQTRAQRQAHLLREAQAMAQLSHPNVVSVHDVGTVEGHVFVAMELVQGQTLRAWMRSSPRTLQQRLHALMEAGRGLAAAHAAGIVHRDFKPDNVLVGTDGRIRVTDFGLARPMESALEQETPRAEQNSWSGETNLTRTGVLKGTLGYMAPEQFQERPTDGRTDQFAFCIAAYEAFYGHRPFLGRTHLEVSRAVCAGVTREEPRDAPVSLALRHVLLRGLSVDPAERFPSLPLLLDALAAAGAERAGGRRRAGRWVAGGAGVVALTVAALVWVPRPSAPPRAASTPLARAEPPSASPPAPVPGPTGAVPAPRTETAPSPTRPLASASPTRLRLKAPLRKRTFRPQAARQVSTAATYDDAPLEPSFVRGGKR